MSFGTVALGEVCNFENGDRGKNYPSKGSFVETGIPFINAGNLSDIGIDIDSINYITEEQYERLRGGKIRENDILYCLRGSLGKYSVVKNIPKGAIASSLIIIRVGDELNNDYLKHYLGSKLCAREIDKFENGAAQPNLSGRDLKKFKIPLPPLKEQKRIAAILDKADAIRRKRQEAMALADEFLRSVFLDMFGDPVMNPKEWGCKKISEIGEVITGNTPSRKVPAYYGNSIEWIKSDNINTPFHYLTEAEEYLSNEGAAVSRMVSEGSILVTCIAGSKDCIGNIALADRKVAFNQQINAIAPYDETNVFFVYAQLLFNKKLVQNASNKSMKGMVNKSKFSDIELIMPDSGLQEKYASVFKKTLVFIDQLKDSKEMTELFFSSLSQQVFRVQKS